MPAKDQVHSAFTTALDKDGWSITEEQVLLVVAKRRLFLDIQARNRTSMIAVLVELKGFENMNSPVDYLMHTVGQYIVYRAALNYLQNPLPLFLAAPTTAYKGILSEPLGLEVIR